MSFIVFFLHYQFLFILFKLVKLIKHISINILSFFLKKKIFLQHYTSIFLVIIIVLVSKHDTHILKQPSQKVALVIWADLLARKHCQQPHGKLAAQQKTYQQ